MTLERITTISQLPERPADSHKGRYGTVLVVGGSRGMAGAPSLAGAAALRSGAGLVRVACPASIQPTVASFEPSYMTLPLPEDEDGRVHGDSAREKLASALKSATVLAMGPGLSQSAGLRSLARWVAEEVGLPTVLDADALNALALPAEGDSSRKPQPEIPEPLRKLKRPVVVTPHPGEFARLTGTTIAEVQKDREGHAVRLAQAENLVVVLKGFQTVVTDGHRVYVNTTGNPGMAKGGSGDVLTGVIGALIGQHLPAFEAAVLGVYIHGLAGDLAREQSGEIGMIAGDLVDMLPDAFLHHDA
jgi:NAD(P)H-hydrate epimerase